MSIKSRRYNFELGCIDIMAKPWYVDLVIDLLTAGLMALWFWGSYSMIHIYGPDPVLILASTGFAIVAMLAIHGRYITYVNLADGWFVLGKEPPQGDSPEEIDRDDQEERP